LVAAACLVRFFVVTPGPFREDFHGYATLGLDPLTVPGYPTVNSSYLVLMGWLGLHGDRMIAANQVFSSVAVVPAVLVGRELLGGTLPGLIAGAVITLHPLLARIGASEDPYTFFSLMVLLAVVLGRYSMRRRNLLGVAGAAVLASVAVFTRDATVVAGPVFFVLTVMRMPGRRGLACIALCLLPSAISVIRVLTFQELASTDSTSAGASGLGLWLAVAKWATVGGLQVLNTPAAFPVLAVVGLAIMVWRRPASAIRIILAMGLLQGPYAVILHSATAPHCPARHLSPAIYFWAMTAATALANVVDLIATNLARQGAGLKATVSLVLLVAAMSDVGPLLTQTTVLEREYQVMKVCLSRLPAEARYLPIVEHKAVHVSVESGWFRTERPAWKPLSAPVAFDDRWEKRRVPAVLFIDHGCSANLTMGAVPDFSRATDATPWGPMVPECARAFHSRAWQTVVRVDLSVEGAEDRPRSMVPVGCLIEVPEMGR
jgi:hypothetical protein